MILIKEKTHIYQFQHVNRVSVFSEEIKSLNFYFNNGGIIKFIFDSEDKLNNAVKKFENAFVANNNVIIDMAWLGASKSTNNQ